MRSFIDGTNGVKAMVENADKKKIIDDIRKEIEASKNTHIWSDYVNALKLISQVVFTRGSGFVLELIQNAEDAGLGLEEPGVFEVKLRQDRVKVTHNGLPFRENNVQALCGIRSSKKPERGTLGYLGIGFKSVFKVTDRPEIYSNGFHFKFDRNHKDWNNPSNTPWHVIPIWIDEPSEIINEERTTFIIPLRDENCYSALRKEIEKLTMELYLFLRWLKKIEVHDEITGETWNVENIGESEEGVTTLRHDGQMQRFKFFRRIVEVPEEVKQDRLTQEYRANVTKREIAIAFALDEEGNLAPSQAGAMYGGVYSFLPLGEARSGAKFPIQADFLVQPGRDAINYEAKWNHWLVEEVASLCKEAIDFFKKHENWRYQFLQAFEFSKSKGFESYEKLFGPKLIGPVEDFLIEDDCVPTSDGTWAKPKQVVQLTEDQSAYRNLINMRILDENASASIMGGKPDLRFVHPEATVPDSMGIKKVDRWDILENDSFLENKGQTSDAANWFRSFYLWLQKYPRYDKYFYYKWREKLKTYHEYKFVLTSEGKLAKGGEVFLLDLPSSDSLIKELAKEMQSTKSILHPDILTGSTEEQGKLRGFLTGLTGVQIFNTKTFRMKTLLPKICVTSPKPSEDILLKYTIYCQQILGEEVCHDCELWILTKDGGIRTAKEVLFSTEFKPEQNWETNQQYVSGVSFISPKYLSDVTTEPQLVAWRSFFKLGGVKDAPDNGVEEFAMNYALEKFRAKYKNVIAVDKRNFGYDLKAETLKGEKIHIEVKGLSRDQDVELTENETKAADMHKDSFYLCVVSSIPENPAMHLVQNPAAPGVGKKDKLTVEINTWKTAGFP